MTRALTALLDHDDYTRAKCAGGPAGAGTLLVCDPDLHFELRREGVAHRTLWEFVSRATLECAEGQAEEARAFWQAEARIDFEGVDLLALAAYRHWAVINRLTWTQVALRAAIDGLRPVTAVVLDAGCGHGLDQPPGHDQMPLLFALFRGLAEEKGLRIETIDGGGAGAGPAYEDRAAQAAACGLPAVDPAAYLWGRRYVLFAGSAGDLPRQAALMQAAGEALRLPMVQLYKTAAGEDVARIQAAGHAAWHESQVSGGIAAMPDVPGATRAWRALRDAAAQASPLTRMLFGGRHLDMHFDFIFGDYARRMAWHVLTWRRFLGEFRPALVVAHSPVPLCDVAHEMGIPVLILPHGMLVEPLRLASQAHLTLAVGGEAQVRELQDMGIPTDRVHVTGDPAAGELLALAQRLPGDNSLAARAAAKRELGFDPTQRVILLLMGNLGLLSKLDVIPRIDWGRAAGCFDELGAMLRRHPDWRLVIKPHPRYDHPRLYEPLKEARVGAQVLIERSRGLGELVVAADAVGGLVGSSAVIEAAYFDVPVYVLEELFVRMPGGLAGWARWKDVAEMEGELARIFADAENHRAQVGRSKAALEAFLGGPPQPAAPRCINLMERMIRDGSR